ncbi:arylacetamide deacetylase-like 4 [Lacerta agilis]|uniref:arylacetamide deacetylase-like 4 n=1 Tax=Lacerta agilis TaxID=80427 RepID=UPI001419F740|nr:arylacetamide deacetylase-like 4 [Lacerta agilis]
MVFGETLWMLILYTTIFIHFLLFAWGAYYRLTRLHLPRGMNYRAIVLFSDFSVGYFIILATFLEKLGICHRYSVMRSIGRLTALRKDSNLIIKDLVFDGVPVRVFWPGTLAGNRKGIIFFHPGVGLFGSIEASQGNCCSFASQTDSVVISVDTERNVALEVKRISNSRGNAKCDPGKCQMLMISYFLFRFHLAPEHPYPVPVQDCLTAAIYFLKNAKEYGVDPSRIAIVGGSSGGTFAAAICQELVTREDLPRVRAQVLIYPFLQGMDFNLPSYQQNHSVPPLFWKRTVKLGLTYLTGKTINVDGVLKGAHVPPDLREKYQKWISADNIPEEFKARGYIPVVPAPFSEELYEQVKRGAETMFCPLLAEDDIIRQLPETFILTCEYDVLRDDGLLYKKRLEDNGVPVTYHHLPDGFHGILGAAGCGPLEFPSTKKCMQHVVEFLKGL